MVLNERSFEEGAVTVYRNHKNAQHLRFGLSYARKLLQGPELAQPIPIFWNNGKREPQRDLYIKVSCEDPV